MMTKTALQLTLAALAITALLAPAASAQVPIIAPDPDCDSGQAIVINGESVTCAPDTDANALCDIDDAPTEASDDELFPTCFSPALCSEGGPLNETEFEGVCDGEVPPGLVPCDPAGTTSPSCQAFIEALIEDTLPDAQPPGPTVNVTAPQSSINEGRSIDLTVRRSSATAPTQATLALSGAATYGAGSDYTTDPAASGNSVTVTFSGSSLTARLTLIANPDTQTEPAESVVATVQAGSGYSAGTPSSATVNINHVAAPVISIGSNVESVGLNEGQQGTVSVTRQAPAGQQIDTTQPLRVGITYTGASWPTDLQPQPPAEVVIAAGAVTASFQFSNVQESDADGIKTVVFSPATSNGYTIDAADPQVAIELRDDDKPQVGVRATDAIAREESGASANAATFEVTRSGSTAGALVVRYAVAGTAECRVDYTSSSACDGTSLTVPAGQSVVTVTVSVVDDAAREGLETVRFTLDDTQSAYTVPAATRSATVDVQDNDVATVVLAAIDSAASESGADPASFRVSRDVAGASALTVTLSYAGTAGSGDFTAPATVEIPAGATSATVTVTPVQDSADEADETVIAAIVSPSDLAYQGSGGPLTVATILDDDAPLADADGDGVGDGLDNCPSTANANQANADGDVQGDACDGDDDNDTLTDEAEATRGTDARKADSDGDGRSDGDEVAAGTDPKDVASPAFAPSGVVAQPSPAGNGILIAWTAPAGTGVDRYLIFRASTPTLIGTVSAVVGRTSYEFLDAEYPGGTHAYFVQPMFPGQAGTAFDAARAVGSPEQEFDVCEAFAADADRDGLCDEEEGRIGTSTQTGDSDGDGLTDLAEVESGSDPLTPDTVAGGETGLTEEGPFWVGLTLVVATLVVLVIAATVRGKATVQGRSSPPLETRP